MQTRHPLFDDLAKIAQSAAGIAQGVGDEARTFWQSQMERIIIDMDLVRREELDVLNDRIAALEAKLAQTEGQNEPSTKAKRSSAKGNAKNS